MAEINNLTEITENFDTIKTLLNSIRAQGILNTSDVDKLLSGINSKLEKLNTEEDIDLIKIFLSELKQNLDERHNVLISKFGAIESLFSNLLKNSSESVKSNELKELFDIVATNLSVFSREVVAQKETLTDITLRLDAMRSDDSQKKDIIKNISLLKNDLERLTNGFDSVVLSLNENFKSIIKAISSIDQSEAISRFGQDLGDVVNSSNTVLSALQVIDKKNEQLEEGIKLLATQEDISVVKKWLSDLTAKNHELSGSVDNLADKYYKIDNLAEKIDASVNIIAGLKNAIAENDEESRHAVLDRINVLEAMLAEVSENKKFEEFKDSLEAFLKDVSEGSSNLQNALFNASDEIQKINANIQALDINVQFQTLGSDLAKAGHDIKEHVTNAADKITQLSDINVTRTLNEISASADALGSKLSETRGTISALCEKSFAEITDNISELKGVVSQIDENNVSANNAIFSNITDRLAMFENSLKNSLEKQEDYVANSSSKLVEEITNIKNLSGVLDYKLDSSVIEIENSKREFTSLKTSVENVLALDFVNTVKDLKVDLFAIKEDLANAIDTSATEINDKLSNDLFGKYELLISKLDSAEDEIKKAQALSLGNLKNVLDNISASIVDILSYVSERKEINTDSLEIKLANIAETVKESNLNYVENVRDIVEVIRTQVENNLIQIKKENSAEVATINEAVNKSKEEIKEEIKYSYNKLLEVQDCFNEIKDNLSINNVSLNNNINGMLSSADELKADFDVKLSALKNVLLDKVSDFKKEFTCENADKISELKFSAENLHAKSVQNAVEIKDELKTAMTEVVDSLKQNVKELTEQFTNASDNLHAANSDFAASVDEKIQSVVGNFKTLDTSVNSLSETTKSSLTGTLAQILDNFVSLKALLNSFNERNAADYAKNAEAIAADFSKLKDELVSIDANIDEDLARQISIIEGNFDELAASLSAMFERSDSTLADKINDGFAGIKDKMSAAVAEKLEHYKSTIEDLFDSISGKNNEQAEFIKERVLELNQILKENIKIQNKSFEVSVKEIASNLKNVLDENIELTSADYNALKAKLGEFAAEIEDKNKSMMDELRAQFDDVTKYIDSGLEIQSQEVSNKFDEIESMLNDSADIVTSSVNNINTKFNSITAQYNGISELVKKVSEAALEVQRKINAGIDDINSSVNSLKNDVDKSVTDKSFLIINNLEEINNEIKTKGQELLSGLLGAAADTKAFTESFIEGQISETKTLIEQSGSLQNEFVSETAKSIIEEQQKTLNYFKEQMNTINDFFADTGLYEKIRVLLEAQSMTLEAQTGNLGAVLNSSVSEIREAFDDNFNRLLVANTDISAGELQTMEAFANRILEQTELGKQNVLTCKNLIVELINNQFNIISGNIEKETDAIISDLLDHFSNLKDLQRDELAQLTVQIEGSVQDYLFSAIEDLKSYMDVKTDSAVVNGKLDNLKTDLGNSAEEMLENINKLLETSVFSSALSDLRAANEVLISSMVDKLNKQIQDFVSENVVQNLDEKLSLLDKKFVDTLVDKYEEIKLITSDYKSAFDKIEAALGDLVIKFAAEKDDLNKSLNNILGGINNSINDLSAGFADLKAQILNKSFDEAFQASLNNQISGIEDLIREQIGYIEDISELCCNNLPELTEMNMIVKHGVQQSLGELSDKLEAFDYSSSDRAKNLEKELNGFKTEIITQFISLFNQISFVAEQEEILDFIQEKHSELITILSHIVNTTDTVETVKDNLAVVDNKMDSLKEDIDLINEKITSIISSEGDINYVYSLQDLESDIANLRLVLNEMKEDNKSKEFEELIASTNDIYKLVESVKTEMPKFEYDEFKRDFDSLNEDIVSISTRTNKLILASDESYKTLQDNLQDFKLVINDLDERTKNFAHESGLDRIDNKLGSLNTMIQNGAKTNQVFNQVFEYLAEWVDKAGEQINTISDRVETLDDIGQIKVMLEDLKAEAEDSSESTELVEALSNVFEKQAKRISSLESKLDRIIVETTISNKNNKIDISPMEETLNRFLVAIDDRMSAQQDKINSLEAKLEDVVSLIDPKDTAQLTKKVGGMDRQIAKLNKSIEKIASHVVEK